MSGTEHALAKRAARTVEIAEARGADTVKASILRREAFSLEVRGGEVDTLSESHSQTLNLTLSRGTRRATVSTCVLTDEAIGELVDTALQLCLYTDDDPYYSLPDEAWLAREPKRLDAFDERIRAITVAEKIAMARELERCLLDRAPEMKSDGATYNSSCVTSALANSLGFCEEKRGTIVKLGISAFAEDRVSEGDPNTGRRQMASWSSRVRHLEDLDPIDEIADQAIMRVRRRLGARKPETGSFPVYFEPAMAQSLWQHLVSAIAGTAVYRNESYLADKLGERIAGPLIEIRDEPFLSRGIGSRWYDTEGVACEPRTLVEDGVLRSFTLGTYAARKLGMRATGHAGGITNLMVRPGQASEEEMLRHMGTGVWVTSVLGQGVNIQTGDYSRGATGLWVENGEPAYPIAEFTINSNLLAMLTGIEVLGSDILPNYTILTPGLVIGEMAVSGS